MASSRQYLIAETILTKWNATAALATSCPGGLKFHLTKQPADTSAISEPYANFTIDITNVKKQAGTGVQAITAIVTFEIWGGVAMEVSNALGDVQATFTYGQTLTSPTGGTFIGMSSEPNDTIKPNMWKRGGKINRQGVHIAKVMVSM